MLKAVFVDIVVERCAAILIEVIAHVSTVGAKLHGKGRKTELRIQIYLILVEKDFNTLRQFFIYTTI